MKRRSFQSTKDSRNLDVILGERCNKVGDFGYTNILGTPFLKFDVRCLLQKNHEGLHKTRHNLRLAPTYEENGIDIVRGTVKVTEFIEIEWEVEEK